MRRYLIFSLGILLSTIFISCELFLTQPPKPKLHAMYIGLDYHYTISVESNDNTYNLSNITGPIQDIKEVAVAIEQLKSERYFSQGGSSILLVEEEDFDAPVQLLPTQNGIKNRIETYYKGNSNEITENDIFLLYYTGHGGSADMPMIVASEGSPVGEVITKKEITDWVKPIQGKKIIILDSCFSGQVVDEYPREPDERDIGSYVPGTFFLSASAASQTAKEARFIEIDHRHGFFSYYFLRAIGWNHSPEATSQMEIGTGEHMRDITVPGRIDFPTLNGGVMSLGDIYRYISDYFRFTERWITYQTPQTTLGPIDLILFQQ